MQIYIFQYEAPDPSAKQHDYKVSLSGQTGTLLVQTIEPFRLC